MASKRINAIVASLEELEWLLGFTEGHHIENVIYDPTTRTVRFISSGSAMNEVRPGDQILDVRLSRILHLFKNKRKKFVEIPG